MNTGLGPPTTERVVGHTDEEINARIQRQTEANVAYFAGGTSRLIRKRLRELDREWDIERVMETMLQRLPWRDWLGRFINRGWFLVPTHVAGFLLQHAIQGWCPPVPVLAA